MNLSIIRHQHGTPFVSEKLAVLWRNVDEAVEAVNKNRDIKPTRLYDTFQEYLQDVSQKCNQSYGALLKIQHELNEIVAFQEFTLDVIISIELNLGILLRAFDLYNTKLANLVQSATTLSPESPTALKIEGFGYAGFAMAIGASLHSMKHSDLRTKALFTLTSAALASVSYSKLLKGFTSDAIIDQETPKEDSDESLDFIDVYGQYMFELNNDCRSYVKKMDDDIRQLTKADTTVYQINENVAAMVGKTIAFRESLTRVESDTIDLYRYIERLESDLFYNDVD